MNRNLFSASALLLGLTACTTEKDAQTTDGGPGGLGPDGVLGAMFNVGELAPKRPAHEKLPACRDGADPYWCAAFPLAPGDWVGEGSPFGDLVFDDAVCADEGYCFSGHLTDRTIISGSYFIRPELFKMTWAGGEVIGLPPRIEAGVLILERAGVDEGHPEEIERLRAVSAL
jgi:hypothetical protein